LKATKVERKVVWKRRIRGGECTFRRDVLPESFGEIVLARDDRLDELWGFIVEEIPEGSIEKEVGVFLLLLTRKERWETTETSRRGKGFLEGKNREEESGEHIQNVSDDAKTPHVDCHIMLLFLHQLRS
jgi:hypothetical protein